MLARNLDIVHSFPPVSEQTASYNTESGNARENANTKSLSTRETNPSM